MLKKFLVIIVSLVLLWGAYKLSNTITNPKDAIAQYKLAKTYDDDGSEELNYERAAELYKLSADQGNSDAQNAMGSMYYYGDGVEKDYKKSVAFYKLAVKQNNKKAQFNLAEMYMAAEGVEKDEKIAIELYKKSAKQGYTEAEYSLGILYEYGDGIKQDYTKAIALYQRSAMKNNNDSLYRLGKIYKEGKIAKQDYKKTFKYYEQISEPMDYGVYEELAFLYDTGKGVDQNHSKAEELYKKASNLQYKTAIKSLSSANKKILNKGKPSLRLAVTAKKTASFFGGKPLVSVDFVWPHNDGIPLSFIGQLDLGEINTGSIPWLPSKGRLLFFYDIVDAPWGIYPKDQKSSLVLYDDGLSVLHTKEYPAALKKDATIHATKYLRAENLMSYPTANRIIFSSNSDYEAYYDFLNEYYMSPHHQVDGYPSSIQSDTMERECQKIDEANTQRVNLEDDWKLLLQFDTDEELGVMWGDLGRIYFWIRKSDAIKNVFTNTCLILQSY